MGKSLEQMERLSQKRRHYRIHLNRITEQKLEEKLSNLSEQHEKVLLRLRTDRKVEEQRQQLLGITVEQIITQMHASSSTTTSRRHSKHSTLASESSCRLFSQNCQLYPCQPMHQYTSFMRKENDQTNRERQPSMVTSSSSLLSSNSHWQNISSNMEENQSRQEFALTFRNQRYLASRHLSMSRTMARLDEQSRLLRERLADKKQFLHPKEEQSALRQAIKRHLEISAKFCLTAN